MKHIFLIITILITVGLSAQSTKKTTSGGNTAKNTKPAVKAPKVKTTVRQSLSEFRKIPWGTPLDSIFIDGAKPTFIKTTEFGKSESNAFYIENENLIIGSVQLQKIFYVFTPDSSLSRVVLIGDKKKFGEMKYIISYKFGEPVIEDKTDGYDCVWTLEDCKIRLTFSNDLPVFTTNFRSDYELSNSKRENRSVDDF